MNDEERRRILEFLRQSNAIEDIQNIDYGAMNEHELHRGYFAAFASAQQAAQKRFTLSEAMICHWQSEITHEQVRFGHQMEPLGIGKWRNPALPMDVRVGDHVAPSFNEVPSLVTALLADINHSLQSAKRPIADVDLAILLGDYFQRFEGIHPFIDGNGRTGRLIANYICMFFDRPILVFPFASRQQFYDAHKSKNAMRGYMATRIKDAIHFKNELMLPSEPDAVESMVSGRYRGVRSGETIIVEWHQLERAKSDWAKAQAGGAYGQS